MLELKRLAIYLLDISLLEWYVKYSSRVKTAALLLEFLNGDTGGQFLPMSSLGNGRDTAARRHRHRHRLQLVCGASKCECEPGP
jgi:hypothetical protein